MLSEETAQLVSECPEGFQEDLESLDSEEIHELQLELKGAAGMATDRCESSIEQIKSKPFFEKFESHSATRKDLLQFFVLWTQDHIRPCSPGELACQLEKVITDFEDDTGANFTKFLESHFPQEERDSVKHSLILIAILNGD